MKHHVVLTPKFVEYIPNDLEEETIYVSMVLATAVHKCCCGCGNEVVTPLSPTDWQLTFDGVSISLYPSIGNWSFDCQSHYWIKCNRIKWAARWSYKEIEAGRTDDRLTKKKYFDTTEAPTERDTKASTGRFIKGKPLQKLWQKLKKR